jgi:hypothetical protein
MTKRLLISLALTSAFFMAGCAQQPGSETGVNPSASESSIPPVLTTPSTGPSKASIPGEISVTGTVERMDIEGGCTVLRTETETYEIKGGDPSILKAGQRVTVNGKVRTDMMTICQVGPVLEVSSSKPA